MTIDMTNYQKENIEKETDKAFINGFEQAIKEVDTALFNYFDNQEEMPEIFQKIDKDVTTFFVQYLKDFLYSTRDNFLVSILDEQECKK